VNTYHAPIIHKAENALVQKAMSRTPKREGIWMSRRRLKGIPRAAKIAKITTIAIEPATSTKRTVTTLSIKLAKCYQILLIFDGFRERMALSLWVKHRFGAIEYGRNSTEDLSDLLLDINGDSYPDVSTRQQLRRRSESAAITPTRVFHDPASPSHLGA
jgi:hypothetical protein